MADRATEEDFPHHRHDEYQRNVRSNRFANREHERRISKAFHDVYEHLAPMYGWTTQKRSAVPWDDLPENQQQLMKAVVSELLRTGVICPLGRSALGTCGKQNCLHRPHKLSECKFDDAWAVA